MALGTITVDVGLEPTEKAKGFVRSVVIDVLKEAVGEGDWLERYIKEAIQKEIANQVKMMLTQAPVMVV